MQTEHGARHRAKTVKTIQEVATIKTSQKGIDLIKHFESLHDGDLSVIGLQPKMCPAGVWTEGWGHVIRDGNGNVLKGAENKGMAYAYSTIHTEKKADEVLINEDLPVYEAIVMRKLSIPVNQNQFDALASHTYNTGGSSTLFRLINNKASRDEIYKWFTEHYIMGDGKVLPGLVKRRKAEADLYFTI